MTSVSDVCVCVCVRVCVRMLTVYFEQEQDEGGKVLAMRPNPLAAFLTEA